jgi:hypothetical protein
MPRCTIKHTINNTDYYMHFSGICDEPLTNFMPLDQFKEYYINEYSEDDWKSFQMGNRNMNDIDWAVLSYNLNIPENKQLTKERFIEKFMVKE